jgi:hypothetical protein
LVNVRFSRKKTPNRSHGTSSKGPQADIDLRRRELVCGFGGKHARLVEFANELLDPLFLIVGR